MNSNLEQCPDCKAFFPHSNISSHSYLGGSSGCWAYFCEVLAREGELFGYPPVHRLLVDSYAAQHPGTKERRSIQSVGLHLIALYMALELKKPPYYDYQRNEKIS